MKAKLVDAVHMIVSQTGQLARESTIIQGGVSLLLVGTVCYLYVTEKTVPSDLTQFIWLILGFWLGSKLSFKRDTASA